MTINVYLIRILISMGVGIGFMFTLAAWLGIEDARPMIGTGPYVLFCIFLIITITSACLLWNIK